MASVCVSLQGFREQTQHWPVQPIDLAIAWMKKQSPGWVAADFGCGDAQLASCVPQQVHSFDLVATTPAVTACNMAQVPIGTFCVEQIACGLLCGQGICNLCSMHSFVYVVFVSHVAAYNMAEVLEAVSFE